jgi:hypothetical protein
MPLFFSLELKAVKDAKYSPPLPTHDARVARRLRRTLIRLSQPGRLSVRILIQLEKCRTQVMM